MLDRTKLNRYLLHKQHLASDSQTGDVVGIATDLLGLHATSPTTPYLSLLARSPGFTRDQLERELYENRSLVKIKCFRRTIFILPPGLVPMAFSATKNLSSLTPSQYDRHLSVSPAQYEEICTQIGQVLRGRALTASELKDELSFEESLTRIINYMCDQGFLVRGRPKSSWKSNQHYYHLFADLHPRVQLDAIPEGEATRQLIARYIQSYGPVTVTDISWWSGLGKTLIRSHLSDLDSELVHTGIAGLEGDYLMHKEDLSSLQDYKAPAEPSIRLLPLLDPYVMGYKDRERYLTPEHYHHVIDRSGNATPTILLDGEVIGVWDASNDKDRLVKIYLFDPDLHSNLLETIEPEALRMGRFLQNQEVSVRLCQSMALLTDRTAGGFMSPLRDS